MIPLNSFLRQGEAVSALIRQARVGRMTHALLISGEAGVGKWTFAQGLAATLMCTGPEKERPCGRCRACAQMENLTHPDVIVIQKGAPLTHTDAKTVIPVSDIQEMTRLVSLQGYEGNRHAVLIRSAEDMNEAAQNKLLKTLEEPPEGVYFLLTCVHTDRLLPTIISRCRPMKLHPWGDEDVRRALQESGVPEEKIRAVLPEAGGSFGRAQQIAGDEEYWRFREDVIRDFLEIRQRSDILRVSSKWKDQKDQANKLFSILENFISQLDRVTLRGREHAAAPAGCPVKWLRFAERARPEQYVQLFDALSLAQRRIQNQVNFQAAMEQLILTLMEAVDK